MVLDIGVTFCNIRDKLADISVDKPATTIIAVSKGQGIEAIESAIKAGVIHFGENKLQEALVKFPALKKQYPHIKLHMIGGIQSNKIGEIAELFDCIQTIDRKKLAELFARHCEKPKATKQSREFLIQVNTGNEKQKSGVAIEELEALLRFCEGKIKISGLMCIPPADANPEPHFILLKQLAKTYNLEKLSMGMSADYEIAAKVGASYVRVGTALFGARK
jgi:PLP dependent protein